MSLTRLFQAIPQPRCDCNALTRGVETIQMRDWFSLREGAEVPFGSVALLGQSTNPFRSGPDSVAKLFGRRLRSFVSVVAVRRSRSPLWELCRLLTTDT